MNDNNMSNVPVLSIGKVVEKLSDAYCTVIQKHLPVKVIPSVMLWGPPGVGKSQAIRQIATKIEERTEKRVKITDVRLLLFNPIDLRGHSDSQCRKNTCRLVETSDFSNGFRRRCYQYSVS